jgi:hypothetical protein
MVNTLEHYQNHTEIVSCFQVGPTPVLIPNISSELSTTGPPSTRPDTMKGMGQVIDPKLGPFLVTDGVCCYY